MLIINVTNEHLDVFHIWEVCGVVMAKSWFHDKRKSFNCDGNVPHGNEEARPEVGEGKTKEDVDQFSLWLQHYCVQVSESERWMNTWWSGPWDVFSPPARDTLGLMINAVLFTTDAVNSKSVPSLQHAYMYMCSVHEKTCPKAQKRCGRWQRSPSCTKTSLADTLLFFRWHTGFLFRTQTSVLVLLRKRNWY